MPTSFSFGRRSRNSFGGRRRGSWTMRLIIAAVLALVALGSYFLNTTANPITGQNERVGGVSLQQEVQMGLAAAPEMAQQFGGESDNARGRDEMQTIGQRLLIAVPDVYTNADDIPYAFSFTLLDDDQTVNAFALPGGPTFITDALYNRLETPGQLAGVMAHEMSHVIHRHGLKRMAQQNLLSGLAGAATVGAGDYSAGQVTAMLGNFLSLSYGRDQEIESDLQGLALMAAAGYDPRAMIGVMRILEAASGSSGSGAPEWSSSHPSPGNRIARIEDAIGQLFPQGVPLDLEP